MDSAWYLALCLASFNICLFDDGPHCRCGSVRVSFCVRLRYLLYFDNSDHCQWENIKTRWILKYVIEISGQWCLAYWSDTKTHKAIHSNNGMEASKNSNYEKHDMDVTFGAQSGKCSAMNVQHWFGMEWLQDMSLLLCGWAMADEDTGAAGYDHHPLQKQWFSLFHFQHFRHCANLIGPVYQLAPRRFTPVEISQRILLLPFGLADVIYGQVWATENLQIVWKQKTIFSQWKC